MQPVQTAPGKRFKDSLLFGVGLFFLLSSCGFALPVVFGLGVVAVGTGNYISLLFSLGLGLLTTVPFVLVGLGLMVWGGWSWIARAKIGAPTVSVSSDVLRGGDEFFLNYQQTFKAATEVSGLAFDLVLRETAIYQRGSHTYTANYDHVVQHEVGPARRYEAGETLTERRRFQLPEQAMHSFKARRNRLNWLVRAQVGLVGWADFKDEYALTVLPEKR